MAVNVEIKARVADLGAIEALLEGRSDVEPVTLEQEDTFFSVPRGRLKIRCDSSGSCELIYYHRDGKKGAMLSRYSRRPLRDPQATKIRLERLFGIKNVVRKSRKLFILGNVRIHLDDVERLGQFVEIEVVLDQDCNETHARLRVRQLMAELQITEDDLLDCAYEDLLGVATGLDTRSLRRSEPALDLIDESKAGALCTVGAFDRRTHMHVPRGGAGLFWALEGVDGVGKSTLARYVTASLADPRIKLLSRRDRPPEDSFVGQAFVRLADLIWGPSNGMQDTLLPPEYWLHLQAAWYAAYAEQVLRPALRDHAVVLMDGWFYKFLARLLVRGFDIEFLLAVFGPAGVPDRVVLLDVDVDSLWKRRADFKPTELGLHHGYRQLGRESFIDYQSRVSRELKRLAERFGWQVIPLCADAPVEVNASLLSEALGSLRTE